jgi:ABC-type bacteriocin/lantibiotic exporter with double-glycine peptidase domain
MTEVLGSSPGQITSSVRVAFNALTRTGRIKLLVVALVQIALSLLDLLGVLAFGLVGALSVNGIESNQPGTRVSFVLEKLGIIHLPFQKQVMIIGIGAAVILISRTLISMIITRKTLLFLANQSATLSARMVSKLLNGNLLTFQYTTRQEILYSLTTGVDSIMLTVLGSIVALSADCFLLVTLTVGLIVVDATMALGTLVLFSSVAISTYLLVHRRVERLAHQNALYTIASNNRVLEALASFREIHVRGIRNDYIESISNSRFQIASNNAQLSQIPNVSKYIIEITTVIGAIAITATQFILQNASHAVAVLAVFLAAGSRVAPAVMRIQNSAISVKSSIGASARTLVLLDRLGSLETGLVETSTPEFEHLGFRGAASIHGVKFTYPESEYPTIHDLSLEIKEGEFIAIVGPSGSGKTTLVDLLLGVIKPESGSISISGMVPDGAIKQWPGAIGYVPQNTFIAENSLANNIIFGFKANDETRGRLAEAIHNSDLSELVTQFPEGLHHKISQEGENLSGGQIQRIGIARALYSKPKFIVLDEATSSLHGQSEGVISSAIQNIKGSVTVVMIAHRLSSIINADRIIYLKNGRILDSGTFSELRLKLPEFDNEAKSMGL